MIEILSKTDPFTCGGTDATQDTEASKTIVSNEMTLFDATSALGWVREPGDPPLGFVSAFAAPAKSGAFLFLQKGESTHDTPESRWALIAESPFPALAALVREQDLAQNNGFHSQTHGLPEDFGGSVHIRYASGETIRFSDNQSPILSLRAAEAIVQTFEAAMGGAGVPLPGAEELAAIRFDEEREDGGFTHAELSLLPDGTGINRKKRRFEDPTVFESEKPVEAETVAAILKNIDSHGMFAWEGLPEADYACENPKSLTFIFKDGSARTVLNRRALPMQLWNGFFRIELEMTTKH